PERTQLSSQRNRWNVRWVYTRQRHNLDIDYVLTTEIYHDIELSPYWVDVVPDNPQIGYDQSRQYFLAKFPVHLRPSLPCGNSHTAFLRPDGGRLPAFPVLEQYCEVKNVAYRCHCSFQRPVRFDAQATLNR